MNFRRRIRWRHLRRLNRSYKAIGLNSYFKILNYKKNWNKGYYQRAANAGDSMVLREIAYDSYWPD